MNYQQLSKTLAEAKDSYGKALYDEHEARAIVRVFLEDYHGFTLSDIFSGRSVEPDAEVWGKILSGMPIQYAVGRALFFGRYFAVRKGVLIPRPETEELCEWIIGESNNTDSILDIGSGSGCIAVTLALETGAEVTAWDIADTALATTLENALALGAKVNVEKRDALNISMERHDALNSGATDRRWDTIVSNPPYICHKEKAAMEHNVLDYEPSLALFVPDDDPMLFYRAIARYATHTLLPGGRLYFEINPLYAKDLVEMLAKEGFTDITLRNDLYGRQRMIRGTIS